MKKAFLLFILSFHLISSTAFEQLMKVPVLFQHFFEHKSLNNEITFVTYLIDHYNDVPHTDDDEARDNQLPFKSTSEQFAKGISLAFPQFYTFKIKAPFPKVVKLAVIYQEGHIPSICHGKIWQPPKQFIYS